MSLTYKLELYTKEGLGIIALKSARLPFRVFSKNKYKIMFKPNFDGAKFYLINTDAVDVEKLLKFDNAYAAMSYLRQIENFDLSDLPK